MPSARQRQHGQPCLAHSGSPHRAVLRFGACMLALATAYPVWSTPAPVARGDVCVTNGEIAVQSDGRFAVETPSSRAVTRSGDDDYAGLVFEYLGPTAGTAPFASGAVKQQLGVKLRGENSCNSIHVMWGIAPDAGLIVVSKLNQGKTTHAQCGVKGYKLLQPTYHRPVAPIEVGKPRRLEATISKRILEVKVDGQLVWRGDIGKRADGLYGYAGLRTDNVRVRFSWLAEAEPASAEPAPPKPKLSCRPVN